MWIVETVPGVKQVELSSRLVDSPAIVVGHESASEHTPKMTRSRPRACAYAMHTMHVRHAHAHPMLTGEHAQDDDDGRVGRHSQAARSAARNQRQAPDHQAPRRAARERCGPRLAVARQLFSNALISAGLLDDPRTMLADLNQILEHAARG